VKFDLKTTVPATDFYVSPVNAYTGDVILPWNEGRLAVESHNNQLRMKNTGGGISAWLQGSPELVSSSATSVIPLTVTINSKSLSVGTSNAVTLLTDSEAASEKTVGMAVAQKDTYTDATRPVAGDYYTAVNIVFDSVAPVTP
jgi:hypothetical protein